MFQTDSLLQTSWLSWQVYFCWYLFEVINELFVLCITFILFCIPINLPNFGFGKWIALNYLRLINCSYINQWLPFMLRPDRDLVVVDWIFFPFLEPRIFCQRCGKVPKCLWRCETGGCSYGVRRPYYTAHVLMGAAANWSICSVWLEVNNWKGGI